MKRRAMVATLAMTSLMIGSAVQAGGGGHTPYEPPRGPAVEGLASNCNMGPFGKVSKAGPYNGLCDEMSDTEKCLALIKDNMRSDGTMYPAGADQDRKKFCLQTFEAALIK